MMIKDLFKVETLDARFLPPSGSENTPLPHARPSKWRKPEYYFYYLCFLTLPALMVKCAYDVSQSSHEGYARFEHLLSPGWIPGRKVDNSDEQYRGFRGNVPYMAVVVVLHPLLRRVYDSLFSSSKAGNELAHANGGTKHQDENVSVNSSDSRLQSRLSFDRIFGILFLLVLHGFSAFKVLFIIYINYQIATRLPRSYVGATTWIFNVGILFANELYTGYPYASLFSVIPGSNLGRTLDSYGGLIPRWEVLFNFTILRLIAFNFDYLWMLDRRASSPVEKKNLDTTSFSEKERIKSGASPSSFNFSNYLSYTLYSPLFLAGPIINFNDYISQSTHPLPSISATRITAYAIRFVLSLLTMELLLHHIYVVAISKASPNWSIYSPFQLSMLGYFNLHIIWLKLLLPWRFFRLWALLDGIDAPENMVRCMSDNYSTLAFWRSWHRTFNLWIVRYIYIPLGGSRVGKIRAIANFLAVFTFVAVWHDINLRLLVWGWLIVLFVLPEAICTLLFPAKRWKDHPETYRWLCGVGATGNILMMMAANLVGFAVGLDGLKGLVQGIVDSFGGLVFLLAACGTLFVGSQVMFEIREAERRRGIEMKC